MSSPKKDDAKVEEDVKQEEESSAIRILEDKVKQLEEKLNQLTGGSDEEQPQIPGAIRRNKGAVRMGGGFWDSTKIDFEKDGISLEDDDEEAGDDNLTQSIDIDVRALKEKFHRMEQHQKDGQEQITAILRDQDEIKRLLEDARTEELPSESERMTAEPPRVRIVAPTSVRAADNDFRRSVYSMNRVASTLSLGAPETSLEPDTFSLMMISEVRSASWILGSSSFAFQVILGSMIAINQISESSGSTQFDVPFKVSSVVSMGQFLSIGLCLATQNDILVSIRSFISLGDTSNWDQVIGENGNRSANIWYLRVALPNFMKFSQGVLVTFVSFVIIVQSSNIVDLLKDFTALMVISEVDVLFQLASHGYLGDELRNKTEKVEEINITSITDRLPGNRRRNTGILIGRLMFLVLLFGMFGWWGYFFYNQINGTFFKQKFPDCKDHVDLALEKFGDGECYGGPLNTLECAFENGDCYNFNMAFPLCRGDDLVDVEKEVGDEECNITFATFQCAYDGGDCCPYEITKKPEFYDNECNGGRTNTERCGYDNGECRIFARDFPKCPLDDIAEKEGSSEIILGNGICEGVAYAGEECGREYRDCDVGQIGQDIIFRGAASGTSMEFITTMSDDGSKMMVGLYKTGVTDIYDNNSTGKVRIFSFDQSNMKWTNSSSGNDILGDSPYDRFGFGVAMSGDGKFIIIGSPYFNGDKGKATIYRFNALQNQWDQVGHYLVDSIMTGYTVDITHDGSRVAISSPFAGNDSSGQTGKILVFDLNPLQEKWTQVGQDIYGAVDQLAGYYFVRLCSSRSRVYFSAGYFKGEMALRVYDYDTSDDKWIQLGADIKTPYIQSHQTPAISADGNRVAVSSYTGSNNDYSHHGEVRVFDLNNSGNVTEWKQLGEPIVAQEKKDHDGFGYNVDMSSDGTLLAISTLDPSCLGNPKWCLTGSVELYKYDTRNPPHLPYALLPKKPRNAMKEAERQIDNHVFGWDMSLNRDGSKIYVSGYDHIYEYGFIKVYEVDDLFYTNCVVPNPSWIGDGECFEYEPYYTHQCGFDGGDCSEPLPVEGYHSCFVKNPAEINNRECMDRPPYNTERCGFDGGKCQEPMEVEGYPQCIVRKPNWIGDGECDDQAPYNSYECGFDGGDCLPEKYRGSNSSLST